MIQGLFALALLVLICTGFYCANKLTHDNPFWVRLIVLAPCLTAFATLIAMLNGSYTAYLADILRSLSTILIYLLVASRFSDNPWLDIRKPKGKKK